jgi:L-amino acid N-acyltransferase YncA
MGDHEEAVRHDPEVQQAWKIAEVARARLLECVDAGDTETLAEAQQMLDALQKATVLAADAEDRARVHVGLLTQSEADRRATARHTLPSGRAVRPDTAPRRALGSSLALAALLALAAGAAAWLAARSLARRRKRSR